MREEAHQERTRREPKKRNYAWSGQSQGEALMEIRSDSDLKINRRDWV